MMDNDVSLHDLVELFDASPMSPRSSKTESGCKSYARFSFAVSAVLQWPDVPVPGPVLPLGTSGA